MSLMINSLALYLVEVGFGFGIVAAGPQLYRGLPQVLHYPCREYLEGIE